MENYFDRARTDQKNQQDLLDAMNVHYISGVTISSTTDAGGVTTWSATDNGADLDVYEDCFDQFVFDVGHLPEYSPAFKGTVTPVSYAKPATPSYSQSSTPSYSQPATSSYS